MSEPVLSANTRIYVAGHRGMVGSALVRALERAGCRNLILRSRKELDLLNQAAVREFFQREKPERVFVAAARVGGIHANNTYRADFIYENLTVQNHVLHEAWRGGVQQLMFLGSSCIYPKLAPQPLREESLLSGPLEATNRPYAVAKIAGIEMCDAYRRQYQCDFRALMPTNLYGPGDNFDLQTSHVLPALMRKFHEAKTGHAPSVTVWGSGTPRREFLHVDDLAEATLFLDRLPRMTWEQKIPHNFVNVGCGQDLTIAELARQIAEVTGFSGRLEFDATKPDGTPRKLLDVSLLRSLGWSQGIPLDEGLRSAYRWFLENADTRRH